MLDVETRRVKLREILRSIIIEVTGASVTDDEPLANQIDDADWSQKLSYALCNELEMIVAAKELQSAGSLLQLSIQLESRLAKDRMGQSLVDTYTILEQIAREEYHPDINYHWYACWGDFLNTGNWLTSPDAFDAVEVVWRMEEEFGFSISNQDAQAMQTVGQTVRYLWDRSCEQHFALRHYSKNVCRSTFIFHELRRLLMVRGGLPRNAVRLNAQLGYLLPSWYAQFWKQVQGVFQVTLPQGCLLTFNLGLEKRTTLRELVRMIVSSQPPK